MKIIVTIASFLLILVFFSWMRGEDLASGGVTKSLAIKWDYTSMRGSLPIGLYNTVYYANGVEVGIDKDGVKKILEMIENAKATEIRISSWPLTDEVKSDKLPSLIDSELSNIVRIARKNGSQVAIEFTDIPIHKGYKILK